ncbi:hypothetical protein NDU88_007450 [Pleurodeles waltl]|uniref:Uncharacterized protein n=1 Tax=Pleurodeles waltl TaxID=8319 RepID=A0AAV7VTP9_PLEWA|nr:hypothetical protein NDU88_007450 [Pleurodeles waltl]
MAAGPRCGVAGPGTTSERRAGGGRRRMCPWSLNPARAGLEVPGGACVLLGCTGIIILRPSSGGTEMNCAGECGPLQPINKCNSRSKAPLEEPFRYQVRPASECIRSRPAS